MDGGVVAINKVTRLCVPGVFLIQQLNANTNATSNKKRGKLYSTPVTPIVTVGAVQWANVEGCPTNRQSSSSSSSACAADAGQQQAEPTIPNWAGHQQLFFLC